MEKVSDFIKKKLKVEILSKPQEGGGRSVAGDLGMKDIIAIAKEHGGESKANVKMIVGTCVSCGVTIDNKNAKEIMKEIEAGSVKA